MADYTTSNLAYVGDANTEGNTFGRKAADLISFFGATPVVQQTVSAVTITTVAVSTGGYMFATSSQAAQFLTTINQLVTALKNLGLVA